MSTGKALNAGFLSGDGIEYSLKGIDNSRNHIRLPEMKNMKHFVPPCF